jgi:hypothetical protein
MPRNLLLLALFFFAAASNAEDIVVKENTPEPSLEHPSASDIVSFTKRLYSAAGRKDTLGVVDDFRNEYATLNWDGTLGGKLEALQEMRLMDLQTSVRHAKKMRDLIALLEENPVPEEEEHETTPAATPAPVPLVNNKKKVAEAPAVVNP